MEDVTPDDTEDSRARRSMHSLAELEPGCKGDGALPSLRNISPAEVLELGLRSCRLASH